jgi:hypothetical protein
MTNQQLPQNLKKQKKLAKTPVKPKKKEQPTVPSKLKSAKLVLKIERNGSPLASIHVMPAMTLTALRDLLKIDKKMAEEDRFLHEGKYPVSKPDEKSRKVKDTVSAEKVVTIGLPSNSVDKHSFIDKLKNEEPPTDAVNKLIDKLKDDKSLKLSETKLEDLRQELNQSLDGVLAKPTDDVPMPSDPTSLTLDNWKYLINRNQLLSGIDVMNDPPRRAFKPVIEMPSCIPRFLCNDVSEITASMTYSKRAHKFIKSHMDQNTASASYAFVSASVEMAHSTLNSTSTETQTAYTMGAWNLPQVVVNIEPEDVSLTPDFLNAVAAALKLDPGNDPILDKIKNQEKRMPAYKALTKIFEEFGHLWPSEVTLGGQLSLSDTTQVSAKNTEKMVKDSMVAAVSVNVGKFSGSVGHKSADSTDDKTTDVDKQQSKNFSATGGNTLLAQEPGKWVSTVAPFNSWGTIKMAKLVPIYTLLPDDDIRVIESIIDLCDHEILDFKDGQKISLEFAQSLETIMGKQKKDDKTLAVTSLIPNLLHSETAFGETIVRCATDNPIPDIPSFIIEFPVMGQRDIIAFRCAEGQYSGRYLSVDLPFKSWLSESHGFLGIASGTEKHPIPWYALTLTKKAIDSYCMFKVQILNKNVSAPESTQEAKKTTAKFSTLVSLSPCETRPLVGDTPIPRFLCVNQLLKEAGVASDSWFLAARENEFNEYCAFKISSYESA